MCDYELLKYLHVRNIQWCYVACFLIHVLTVWTLAFAKRFTPIYNGNPSLSRNSSVPRGYKCRVHRECTFTPWLIQRYKISKLQQSSATHMTNKHVDVNCSLIGLIWSNHPRGCWLKRNDRTSTRKWLGWALRRRVKGSKVVHRCQAREGSLQRHFDA